MPAEGRCGQRVEQHPQLPLNVEVTMRRAVAPLLVSVCFSSPIACAHGGPSSPQVQARAAAGSSSERAIRGGTLINPDAPPVPDATVLVRGGRIVCAGAARDCPVPSSIPTIDAADGFIGPGLVDAHVHFGQTGWADGRPDFIDVTREYPYDSVAAELERDPARFGRAYLCSGVTSVFDVGGPSWTVAFAHRTDTATDLPRVEAAGPLLSTLAIPPGWPPRMASQFTYMTTEASIRETVDQRRALGADAVKVWYLEIPDSLHDAKRRQLNLAADQARKDRLRLLVHATELPLAKDALRAGAAVLVHAVDSDTVDAEFLRLARSTGAVVIPTARTITGYGDVGLGRSPAARYPLDCVDPATRRKLTTVLPESLRPPADKVRAFVARTAAIVDTNVARMYSAGVWLAVGTDAGNPGTAHGPSIYAEMEAMQAAGMPAHAVFTAATRGGAEAMALSSEIGRVAPGYVADLAIFAKDPTKDIANARTVQWVLRRGMPHRVADLVGR
ncbi:MAG TPA: amidohydrolase family protein [Gemmatimonadales bacterium]|nr:amidohydrolase family protein [Gemmatimonadales bacterium]